MKSEVHVNYVVFLPKNQKVFNLNLNMRKPDPECTILYNKTGFISSKMSMSWVVGGWGGGAIGKQGKKGGKILVLI